VNKKRQFQRYDHTVLVAFLLANDEPQENRSLSTELSNLRLDNERLAFDQKELEINYEQSAEKVKELTKELDELRLNADARNFAGRDQSAEDKEKKKAEKMALMMAQYDTVRIHITVVRYRLYASTGFHFREG
jgi:hypothetical protein